MVPGLRQPELPSTLGRLRQLRMLCILTCPQSPDAPTGLAKLAPSDVANLTGISSRLFAMADAPNSTRPESPEAQSKRPSRPMKLYHGIGTSDQDSGIAEVMPPAYLGQHHQLWLAVNNQIAGNLASNPLSVDLGTGSASVSWIRTHRQRQLGHRQMAQWSIRKRASS